MNQRPVVELYGLLYQTLTESTAANNDTSDVVLYGSRENLGGRCCDFVCEHNKWQRLVGTPTIASVVLAP